jgi:serine/threonine-protein kinase
MICPGCGAEVAETSRFCPSCGTPVDISSAPTLDSPTTPRARTSPPASRASTVVTPSATPLPGSIPPAAAGSQGQAAHYPPGTILGDRYRIVSLLGRGGMGEVYRADDLKLEQPVALKLLPAAMAGDAASLAGFHREVRVARQVSHPNVCRVFDIAEADDKHFITMEYIDGEDLAMLLRRIGRLPQDKALELARQACAGLAAAHDAGLLHRDLKPANIMIDGRGRARLTDFGLAALAGLVSRDEFRAGTPAYMAPEQIEGQEPSIQSDIYSLGLVFYEMFTGKRAFEARNLQELSQLRQQGTITNPSAHVKDIDPLVERVILRCLENDPRKRPATALQVAAALPGGDPLAAALAAGETPSPAMVAASGDETAIRPQTAALLLAGALACLAGTLALTPYATDLARSPIEKSPEFLQEHARELAKKIGYSERPADSASYFSLNYDFLRYRAEHVKFRERTDALYSISPGAYSYCYRQSPRPMRALRINGVVTLMDPPEEVSGMLLLFLDSKGQLLRLQGVPPQIEEGLPPSAAPDWNVLFAAAGLDPARFSPVTPRWVPTESFDARAAWEGTRAEVPDIKLHVTAAAFHGRVTYFGVFGPWIRPYREEEEPQSTAARVGVVATVALCIFIAVGAMYFARRHVLQKRGDLQGALRVSSGVALAAMVAWALHAHHVADALEELALFFNGLAASLLAGFVAWVLYMALEPFVRRRKPQLLISWSRLLAGQYRDPLVGRDLLAGGLGGALIALAVVIDNAIPYWFDFTGETPLSIASISLGSSREALSGLISLFLSAIVSALIVLTVLFLLHVIVRLEWLSIALTGVFLVLTSLGGENFTLEFPVALVTAAIVVFVLVRFGILALLFAQFFANFIIGAPFTFDFSRWYAGRGIFVLLLSLAAWLWGLRLALAGRPILKLALDE